MMFDMSLFLCSMVYGLFCFMVYGLRSMLCNDVVCVCISMVYGLWLWCFYGLFVLRSMVYDFISMFVCPYLTTLCEVVINKR